MADVVTTAGSLACPDGGSAALSSTAKLTVSSQPVVLYSGLTSVASFVDCTFQVSGSPNPCTGATPVARGQATKLTAGSQPVLLDDLHANTTNNQLPITVTAGQAKLTAS
jgi:hypothetical protein